MGHRLLWHKHAIAELLGEWAWQRKKFDVEKILDDPKQKELGDGMVRTALDMDTNAAVRAPDKKAFLEGMRIDWWHQRRDAKEPLRDPASMLRMVRRYGHWPGPAWWYIHPLAFVLEKEASLGDEEEEVKHAIDLSHTSEFVTDLFQRCRFKCVKPGRAQVVLLSGLNR